MPPACDALAGPTGGAEHRSVLSDALGSTIRLADDAGSMRTTYTYGPFGQATLVAGSPPDTNPYQFTGRENDGADLYYYRARYYTPTWSRFISEDVAWGTDFHRYAYVGNAPTNFIDPLGLWRFSCFGHRCDVNISASWFDSYWVIDEFRWPLSVKEYTVTPWTAGFGINLQIDAPSTPCVSPYVGVGKNLSVGTNLSPRQWDNMSWRDLVLGKWWFEGEGVNISVGPSIGAPGGVVVPRRPPSGL